MTGDEYIKKVFKQAPVPVVVYKGAAFIIDLINEKGLEMWGRSYDSVINRPLFEVNPELRDQYIEEILTRVYTSGEPYIATELPLNYQRNNKPYSGFFNFSFYPVSDENGTIIGITSIGSDVTHEVNSRQRIQLQAMEFENAVKERTADLIHANRELEASEDRIRTIIEAAPDAIVVIDENGEILNWNANAERIFGWKKEEVLGKLLTECIIPERYREQHKQGMKRFLSTGVGNVLNKPIAIESLKKDGGEIPIELKISVSTHGSSPVFIGFVRDISQQKHDAYVLQSKTDELMEAQEQLSLLQNKLIGSKNKEKDKP